MPDLLQRPCEAAGRDGTHAGLVAGRPPSCPAPHRRHPDKPYPCFYGGGGSCAFDRRNSLELGGFDPLLHPFYLEDTDLGYLAWKRGWKVLYQPKSVVFHEHRGTIGKKFSQHYIASILKKNFVLFCWKNVHEWRKLVSHFGRHGETLWSAASWAIRRSAQILQDSGEHSSNCLGPFVRDGEPGRLQPSRTRKHSAARSAATSATGSRAFLFARESCPFSSSRRTRSALRLTAAECSCIRRRPSSHN